MPPTTETLPEPEPTWAGSVLVVRTVDVAVTVATAVVRAGVTRHEHALARVARSKPRNAAGIVPVAA